MPAGSDRGGDVEAIEFDDFIQDPFGDTLHALQQRPLIGMRSRWITRIHESGLRACDEKASRGPVGAPRTSGYAGF